MLKAIFLLISEIVLTLFPKHIVSFSETRLRTMANYGTHFYRETYNKYEVYPKE